MARTGAILLVATLLVAASFEKAPSAEAASPGLVQAAKAATLPLLIINTGTTDPAKLYGVLSGVTPVNATASDRFTWDVGHGKVTDARGHGIATVLGGDLEAQLARVQGVIDTWTTVRVLEHSGHPLDLETHIDPASPVYHDGDRITVVVSGYRHPYLTMMNLASDGTINFVYPTETGTRHDSLTIPSGGVYRLPLQVTPPFGADHFIAITSATALAGLHRALKAIDGQPEAVSILDLLDHALDGQDYQLGIQAVFSAESP